MNTFREPVARGALCFGSSVALVDDPTGAQFTFAEVAALVGHIGGYLDSLGLALGDRVAVLADGSPWYALLYLGIPASGRVVVPLNSRYTRSELEAACEDCEPALLVTDRSAELTDGLAPVVVAVTDFFTALPPAAGLGAITGADEDSLAAIFYTGGTTDRSKGVMMTHRNKLVDALSLIAGLELNEADRWLVMSPMFHAAGSFNVLPCLWVGAAQVFLPRFDAVAALRAIERHRLTITFGVPTMLAALVDAQRELQADVSSLRLLGHGGAPITEALVRRVVEAFPAVELCAMYGATEMAPMATIHRHQQRAVGTPVGRSAGRPVLGVDVSVRAPDGSTVAAGQLGEIVVRGPNIMPGYWRKPDVSAAALRDGAYWSGDVGYLDDNGFLYVIDRTKDMLITGGENVYGTEVEDVLVAYPGVREAAVIGRPDERWGEVVVAIVVVAVASATDGPSVSAAELDRHCRARLAGYKVPRLYEFRDQPLPRSAAGKLLKRELR